MVINYPYAALWELLLAMSCEHTHKRCWLLVMALLPHPEFTACRMEKTALHSLLIQINQSSAPITLQTQTLQPSGTAEKRWRTGRDREDDESRKSSGANQNCTQASPRLYCWGASAQCISRVIYIHPSMLFKQPVTPRVAARQSICHSWEHPGLLLSLGDSRSCALGNKTNSSTLLYTPAQTAHQNQTRWARTARPGGFN